MNKLVKRFRYFLASRAVDRVAPANRKTRVSNFGTARSVALIYTEKGESFYILVKQYVQYLRAEHGIGEVMAMAFVENDKLVPLYHQHKLHFDFFTPSDLSFSLAPQADHIVNFVRKRFDILINLDEELPAPLALVLANSEAALKVGTRTRQLERFYDLMIEPKAGRTFDEYARHVNHYLTVINTPHARA